MKRSLERRRRQKMGLLNGRLKNEQSWWALLFCALLFPALFLSTGQQHRHQSTRHLQCACLPASNIWIDLSHHILRTALLSRMHALNSRICHSWCGGLKVRGMHVGHIIHEEVWAAGRNDMAHRSTLTTTSLISGNLTRMHWSGNSNT
jgi:hypothetical protein